MEDIKKLVENFDKDLTDESVQKWVKNLENRNFPDNHLYKFHRPTQLRPQTAGSYLWGNSQTYYGDVTRGCSPLAIGSRGYSDHCGFSVWYLQNNTLNNIYASNSPSAYIFVDSDWSEFSEQDIEKLTRANVEEAAVFITQNSIHKKLISMQPISDFVVTPPLIKMNNNKSYNGFILFVVALLIIGISFISLT